MVQSKSIFERSSVKRHRVMLIGPTIMPVVYCAYSIPFGSRIHKVVFKSQ